MMQPLRGQINYKSAKKLFEFLGSWPLLVFLVPAREHTRHSEMNRKYSDNHNRLVHQKRVGGGGGWKLFA